MKAFGAARGFLIGLLGLSLNAESHERPFGIILPAGTTMLAKNRFQSGRAYEESVKEMKQRLANSKYLKPLAQEINLPQVRVFSFQSTDATKAPFAINIYLNIQTGITEIFFVEL